MSDKKVISAVSAMSTNVNVGMEEIVSVFVAQYEDNLFDKKKLLSSEIKSVKDEIKDLEKRLTTVDKTPYEMTISVVNIKTRVKDVTIQWKDEEQNIAVSNIRIYVKVCDNTVDHSNRYSSSFSKTIERLIDVNDERDYFKLSDTLSDLNSQLVEVMGLIKSVSRKERQVRGRISKKKLEESGFASLLNDDEMLSLIQLD
jgi:hypothetical protein